MPTPESPKIDDLQQRVDTLVIADDTAYEVQQLTNDIAELNKEKNIDKKAATHLAATLRSKMVENVDKSTELQAAEQKLDTELKKTEALVAPPLQLDSFMTKFNKVDMAGKVSLTIDKMEEVSNQVIDFFLKIGSSTLLQVANMMEKFKLMDPGWIEMIRSVASSEKAILSDQLKATGTFILTPDRANDKRYVNILKKLYTDYKTLNTKPVAAGAQPTPGPSMTDFITTVVEKGMKNDELKKLPKDNEGMIHVTMKQLIDTLYPNP